MAKKIARSAVPTGQNKMVEEMANKDMNA